MMQLTKGGERIEIRPTWFAESRYSKDAKHRRGERDRERSCVAGVRRVSLKR